MSLYPLHASAPVEALKIDQPDMRIPNSAGTLLAIREDGVWREESIHRSGRWCADLEQCRTCLYMSRRG